MYKLLILALFFPFFAFSDDESNDAPLTPEKICSGEDQESVTETLAKLSCDLNLLHIIEENCENDIAQDQSNLLEKGWTQKQLNYIDYYLNIGRNPDITLQIRSAWHIETQEIAKLSNIGELLYLINKLRKIYSLTELQENGISIEGCEDLFPDEPESITSDSESQTDEPSIDKFLEDPLSFICNPSLEGQQKLFAQHLKKYSCYETSTEPVDENCKNSFEENQIDLIKNDWTQKQLNYIGFHVAIGSNNKKVPYTIDINNSTEISPDSSKQEILEFINKIRENYELTEEGLYEAEATGCENLFSDESTTEAGASCIDCKEGEQQKSEITRFQEQIESLQQRLDDDDGRRRRRERNKKN